MKGLRNKPRNKKRHEYRQEHGDDQKKRVWRRQKMVKRGKWRSRKPRRWVINTHDNMQKVSYRIIHLKPIEFYSPMSPQRIPFLKTAVCWQNFLFFLGGQASSSKAFNCLYAAHHIMEGTLPYSEPTCLSVNLM